MEDLARQHFGSVIEKVPSIAVAVIDGDDEHLVPLGGLASHPDPLHSCWEIASITKGFTGTLLVALSLTGEVRLDDPVGAHVGEEVAARLPASAQQPTLEDLATHRSGLPNLPLSWVIRFRGNDPYSKLTTEMVFDRLGPKTRRPKRPRFRYSNLGMGLLGHLLERAAGSSYPELVQERLLDPLGLRATGVGHCVGGAEVVRGMRRGKPVGPWHFGALAGCGALRSTPNDLVTLARHLLDPPSGPVGDAIRLATEPRRDGPAPGMRIGLGWMVRSSPTGEAIWHNGGTLGGSSFLAVDRERSTAVVALGNNGPGLRPPLDAPGWALLDELACR